MKKKLTKGISPDREKVCKIWMTMRLIVFLFFVSLVHVSASVYSQKTKLNIKLENATLQQVFKVIQEQSEFDFFYKNEQIPANARVSVQYQDEAIEVILDKILEGTGLIYHVVDKDIVISVEGTPNSRTNTQQKKTITGKVSDVAESPLPGVSVVVKGTTTGTITDAEGKFSLANVPANATLQFSFVGMKTQEIVVGEKAQINVTLIDETIGLQEVIAVGYGTQSKRTVTGSIQSVGTDDLTDAPVSTVAQKLQGKLSGVQISQTTGKPGEGMQVRIRGQASLTAGNDPLYVVDGFPIIGDISGLNPNEIENISVLKDASSTSLYGSRAANGVILVTTKKAKIGKTAIGVNAYYGFQQVPYDKRPEMMNGTEFAQFKKESYEDLGLAVPAAFQNPSQYGEGYNWYNALLRTSPIQDYSVSMSSGKENFSTSAVAGVFKQDGVIVNSGYSRYSLRLNSEFKVTDNVKAGFNVAPTYSTSSSPNTDGIFFNGGLTSNGLQAWPIIPYQNADGTYPLMAWIPGLSAFPTPNFIRAANEIKNEKRDMRILANTFVQYEPVKGLVLKSTFNFDFGQNRSTGINPSTASTSFIASLPTTSSASFRNSDYTSWLNENTITYQKSYKEHNFDFLGGYTIQKYQMNLAQIKITGFPDDRIPTIGAAANIDRSTATSTYNDIQEWSLMSYIARINYNYKNKYLLSGAVRSDGSSRFGSDKRWGTFPSGSVGWIASEENFMKGIRAVSLLKLRGAFGIVGNNNIGNYTQYAAVSSGSSTYNSVFGSSVGSGVAVSSMLNRSLTWEQTQEYDFGFDLGLFKNRISIGYDFYTRKTKSLLYQVAVAQESGFTNFMGNIGELKFWGHEITLNSKNLTGTFTWTTDFNISFFDNKVTKLYGDADRIYGDGTITKVGQKIGLFYGMIWDGVYKNKAEFDASPKAAASAVGTIKFKDVNNDGVITNGGDKDDRTVIGDPNPTFTYGITNNFSYKNFDLSIIMSGSYGNDVANRLEMGLTNLDGVFNVLKDVKNRWRSEANPGDGKYGTTTTATYMERDWFNSRFISKASFLSIKNVTLGYTVPASKLKYIKNLRVYASVQQLYTFTKYKGMNPEISRLVDGTSASALNLGSDWGGYPVPRTISFGLNLGL
jgi:TonB-linked SusC/RagA family outer membrane protein